MEKKRLDQFLAHQYPQYSRSQIKRLIETGYVTVNGELKKPSYLLKGGEKVAMARRAPELPEAGPEDIPLDILYEDRDIIVINKPAGMVAHPAPGNVHGTLVNALLHHVTDLAGIGGELRPGIVHRLDKGTTGVMIVAKNDQAHRELSRQFKQRIVKKVYRALVFGNFPQKKGTIALPIGRDTAHRRKFSSQSRKTREAVTHYEVEKQYENLALLKVGLETGRTHQIRVHLSEKHHPIVGDTLYGARSFISMVKNETLRHRLEELGRPLLHAAELRVLHPASKKEVEFTAPLPKDFQSVLESL